MRYAAVVAASVAAVATFAFARDGRSSEPAETVRAAVERAVPARLARQEPASRVRGAQDDFRWSGRLARGQEIEIRGIVGDVSAQPASGDQVEVVGRFTGDDGDQLRVEVEETRDGAVICVIYPGHRRDRGEGPCGGGTEWSDGDHDDFDGGVDFTVRVPEGVKLGAYTVAGDIDALQLRSDVEVATVAGDVRVSTSGAANATSVSGDVEATVGRAGEDMDFTTVSGNVVVRLAGDIGAEVEAQTLSGRIESDFELDRGSMSGHDDDDDDHGGFRVNVQIGQRATGVIGRGGPDLNVTTVSGNIRLERAR